MITHTVGAVLAGGSASRMGTDKAMLEYLGVPFIDHVIATMSVVVDTVVVCGGTYAGPLPVVPDAFADAGPLGGILAALRYAEGKAVVVSPVDMPLITVDLISRLVNPPIVSDCVRIASSESTVQPLCGTYGPGVAASLEKYLLGGGRSAFGFLDTVATVEHITADEHTLTNINTPDQYELLL